MVDDNCLSFFFFCWYNYLLMRAQILSRYFWKHNIAGYDLLKSVKYFGTIRNFVLHQSHRINHQVWSFIASQGLIFFFHWVSHICWLTYSVLVQTPNSLVVWIVLKVLICLFMVFMFGRATYSSCVLPQVDLFSSLIVKYWDTSGRMVITGERKKMGRLWKKLTRG